jgi:hypothetical protein
VLVVFDEHLALARSSASAWGTSRLVRAVGRVVTDKAHLALMSALRTPYISARGSG